MRIIILGAGQVGSSLAASLVSEQNDITVVDIDAERLHELELAYDLRTLQGTASHPSVLQKAGAKEADMIIAVTDSDEINMLACQVAYTLYHTPTKLARVRSNEYLNHVTLFAQEALPIDALISPESLLTEYIANLISHPGVLQVVDFADGRARMILVRCQPQSSLDGVSIRQLNRQAPGMEFRVVTVLRGGEAIIPDGDTRLQAGDDIYFIGPTRSMDSMARILRGDDGRERNIMLAGGGNIGQRLATELQHAYQVKLIERRNRVAQRLSETLGSVIVLVGSATDSSLLLEENIDRMDIFCAVTDNDEVNLVSCMLAKQLGAGKVMALINQPQFVDLAHREAIDIVITPQMVTLGALLAHVRRGDVVVVHMLYDGSMEAFEVIVHGDEGSSKVVGRRLEQLQLPEKVNIGAIVRGDEVLIAHHDTVLCSGDHVILLVADKKAVAQVERLFRVAATYL